MNCFHEIYSIIAFKLTVIRRLWMKSKVGDLRGPKESCGSVGSFQHIYTESMNQTHLAALALLDPKVDATILGIVGTIPEDLLGSLILSVAVNSKPGVAVVGKVAVIVDAKASGASTIRDGS
jgi:hypothetical protein